MPGNAGVAKTLPRWLLLIDTNIQRNIITCTNIYIGNISDNVHRNKEDPSNLNEIKAFLVLLYLFGFHKALNANKRNLRATHVQDWLYYIAPCLSRIFFILLWRLRFFNQEELNDFQKKSVYGTPIPTARARVTVEGARSLEVKPICTRKIFFYLVSS